MKPLVAPHIAKLVPEAPGRSARIVAQEQGLPSVAPLGSNENPLGPSPRVREALLSGVDQVHRYPDYTSRDLRAQIADHYGVRPEEVVLGHGSNSLIEVIARTFATPQDHAVIGAPSFSCYRASLLSANVPTSVVPLRDGLYWDMQDVLRAVKPETKLVFLDNPGNPTSTHIPKAALEAFLRELPADVVAVVDEAYAEYAAAPSFGSAIAMRGLRERLIVLRTFSKAYALAGLRVGYGITGEQLIYHIDAMRVPFTVGSLTQLAASAALADAAHLERSVAHNARERARLTESLRAAGLSVVESETNFLLVALPRPAAAVHKALLTRGLLTRMLGPNMPQHLRFSIGLTEENDLLLRSLHEVLAEPAPKLG